MFYCLWKAHVEQIPHTFFSFLRYVFLMCSKNICGKHTVETRPCKSCVNGRFPIYYCSCVHCCFCLVSHNAGALSFQSINNQFIRTYRLQINAISKTLRVNNVQVPTEIPNVVGTSAEKSFVCAVYGVVCKTWVGLTGLGSIVWAGLDCLGWAGMEMGACKVKSKLR